MQTEPFVVFMYLCTGYIFLIYVIYLCFSLVAVAMNQQSWASEVLCTEGQNNEYLYTYSINNTNMAPKRQFKVVCDKRNISLGEFLTRKNH